MPAAAIRSPGESDAAASARGAPDRWRFRRKSARRSPCARSGTTSTSSRPERWSRGVDPKGPAAGKLRPRDVILTVDGRRAPSLTDLRRLIRRHRPGEDVELTVRRGRSRRERSRVETIAGSQTPDPADHRRAHDSPQAASQVEASDPRAHRPRTGGGPVRRARFRSGRGRGARPRGRPRVQGGRDRRAVRGRLRRLGWRAETEDDRRRRPRMDVFLVPAGDNAREAKRSTRATCASSLCIVFDRRCARLATLPRKSAKA